MYITTSVCTPPSELRAWVGVTDTSSQPSSPRRSRYSAGTAVQGRPPAFVGHDQPAIVVLALQLHRQVLDRLRALGRPPGPSAVTVGPRSAHPSPMLRTSTAHCRFLLAGDGRRPAPAPIRERPVSAPGTGAKVTSSPRPAPRARAGPGLSPRRRIPRPERSPLVRSAPTWVRHWSDGLLPRTHPAPGGRSGVWHQGPAALAGEGDRRAQRHARRDRLRVGAQRARLPRRGHRGLRRGTGHDRSPALGGSGRRLPCRGAPHRPAGRGDPARRRLV